MSRARRWLFTGVVVASFLGLGLLAYVVWVGGEVLAGFVAKTLCSCVYVSKRSAEACLRDDLAPYRFTTVTIDDHRRAVRSAAFLIRHATAEFHDHLGCTLR